MPYHILKSEKHNCPKCNPENKENGVMLFHVEGNGRVFYFCGKCVGEFELSGDIMKQTKLVELDMTPTEEDLPEEKIIIQHERPENQDVIVDPTIMTDSNVSTPAM